MRRREIGRPLVVIGVRRDNTYRGSNVLMIYEFNQILYSIEGGVSLHLAKAMNLKTTLCYTPN